MYRAQLLGHTCSRKGIQSNQALHLSISVET